MPEVLQSHETKVISLKECLKRMFAIEDLEAWNTVVYSLDNSVICTANAPGTGACIADSGGPLVSNHTLIGIISWSVGWANNFPDVHTNVYHKLDWIKNEMKLIEKEYPTNK